MKGCEILARAVGLLAGEGSKTGLSEKGSGGGGSGRKGDQLGASTQAASRVQARCVTRA